MSHHRLLTFSPAPQLSLRTRTRPAVALWPASSALVRPKGGISPAEGAARAPEATVAPEDLQRKALRKSCGRLCCPRSTPEACTCDQKGGGRYVGVASCEVKEIKSTNATQRKTHHEKVRKYFQSILENDWGIGKRRSVHCPYDHTSLRWPLLLL